MLSKLERRLGRFAIPNLTLFLVAGQAAAFVLGKTKPEFLAQLVLVPARVLEGEVWRVFTFLFIPSTDSVFFIIFELWLLYIYGRALEQTWGDFRFNVFLLLGWVLSVGAAFLVPHAAATNVFLLASIFLAFAYLNPDFELLLFFILPVKIKWLALGAWGIGAYLFVIGGWSDRALIVAGIFNLVVFFGPDLVRRSRGAGRRTVREREQRVSAKQATHRCAACGLTDVDDPEMQFRYCSQCVGKRGYCKKHLADHEHVRG